MPTIVNHPFLLYVLIASVSLGTALLLTPLVKRLAISFDVVDKPGTRKIHVNTIPRMGGLAIFGGIAVSLAFFAIFNHSDFLDLFFSKGYFNILVGSIIMMVLGIIDDKKGLNAKVKFCVQFAVAIYVVSQGLRVEQITNPFGEPFRLGFWSYPVTVLWIVGITNAINLSDGLDGLASGISLIVSVTMFAISLNSGILGMVVMSAALTGALLGFLKYNFNPAQIFMGDTGSLLLGFLLATLSIKGALVSSTTASILIPFIALGLPIFDTLFAFLRRIITGKNPFSADKEHVHHRLLSFGLNQKQTVTILYITCILFCGIAFALTAAQNEMAASLLLIFGVIIYTGIRRLGYIETILVRLKHERYRQKKKLYKALYYEPEKELPLWYRLSAKKIIFEVIADFSFILVSLFLTRMFVEGLPALSADIHQFRNQLIITCLCCFGSFAVFGFYRAMWRYINLDAIGRSVKGVTLGALLTYFALVFFQPSLGLQPRHLILFWVFLLLLVSASRFLFNFYATYQKRELTRLSGGERVLIYGAGDRGEVILSSLIKEDVLDYKPIGFVDDNPAKQNREILGYAVLGDISSLESIVVANRVQRIIVSSPFVNGNREGVLKEVCRKHNVKLCHFKIQFDPIPLGD